MAYCQASNLLTVIHCGVPMLVMAYFQASNLLKIWFYIALYPVRWTAQSALHFPPLADLFIPTPFSASLGSILAMQQLRNDYSLTFPPLSIARYSFIQLSRLLTVIHCGVPMLVMAYCQASNNSTVIPCAQSKLVMAYCQASNFLIVKAGDGVLSG